MSGASDAQGGDEDAEAESPPAADATDADGEESDLESLRAQVEEKYDFENFGPREMREMSVEEWEAAFDADTWITGERLLDRVERDLKQRVADRDVFARIERDGDRVLAYSDTGYAVVEADGTVEGQGTVLRDVEPTVALASMEDYDVPADPPDTGLPEPQEVPEGSGSLGNNVLQAVAAFQVLAGVVLMGAWLLVSLRVVAPPGGSVRALNVVAMLVMGIVFLAVGLLLFTVVANARLSDRFRAEEYRNRLRAVDLEPGERPDFLPDEDGDRASGGEDALPGDERSDSDG